jgi:hypothetical protein
LERGGRLAKTKILSPAALVNRELLHHHFKAHTPVSSRQLPNPLPEPLHRLRRNAPPRLSIRREANPKPTIV